MNDFYDEFTVLAKWQFGAGMTISQVSTVQVALNWNGLNEAIKL